MKYFIDTEFIEGKQQRKFLGIPLGKTKPTIDLISIGIVAEDGREYYAISKDFNLEEAWNRHDLKIVGKRDGGEIPIYEKQYWLRENVLRPIFNEYYPSRFANLHHYPEFTFENMKKVISYGKTNKEIARDIIEFIAPTNERFDGQAGWYSVETYLKSNKPKFYGYYADYDWVVFAWLFGLMKDLPKGFPYYCIDLKQTLDERGNPDISHLKQGTEHNALADARYHKRIYEFLNTNK